MNAEFENQIRSLRVSLKISCEVYFVFTQNDFRSIGIMVECWS